MKFDAKLTCVSINLEPASTDDAPNEYAYEFVAVGDTKRECVGAIMLRSTSGKQFTIGQEIMFIIGAVDAS